MVINSSLKELLGEGFFPNRKVHIFQQIRQGQLLVGYRGKKENLKETVFGISPSQGEVTIFYTSCVFYEQQAFL